MVIIVFDSPLEIKQNMAENNNVKVQPQQQPVQQATEAPTAQQAKPVVGDPSIYVYEKATGSRVPANSDNIKSFFNNPKYELAPDSSIPVDLGDGLQSFVQLKDYNPSHMKILDSSYQTPNQKYGSLAAQAQNIGRQAANALTLGGYAAVADRFKTPEEREDAKKREDYNPIGTVVGQTLPYLIPAAGEVMGAAKITSTAGKAAYEAATLVPKLGERAAAAMGTIDKALGIAPASQRLASALNMARMGAVDGMAAGFTTGVNTASLNNDFSKEALTNVFTDAAMGGIFGGVGGGLIAGGGAALSKGTSLIGSKGTKGIGSKVGQEIAEGKFKGQGEFADKVYSTPETARMSKSLSDFSGAEHTALAKNNTNQLLKETDDLSTRLSSPIAEGSDDLSRAFKEETVDRMDFMNALASNEKTYGGVLDGNVNFNNLKNDAMTYRSYQKQAMGDDLTKPLDKLKTNLKSQADSMGDTVKNFNNASYAIERNKISQDLSDAKYSGAKFDDTLSLVHTGDNSIYKQSLKALDEVSTKEGIASRVMDQNPNVSLETINRLIESEENKYSKNLATGFKNAISTNGAKLEGKVARGEATYVDLHNFVEDTTKAINDAWYAHKGSLPLGAKVSPDDAALFASIKKPYQEASSSGELFGDQAGLRSITRELRNDMKNATDDLKRAIGQKRGDGPIDTLKLTKSMASSDLLKRRAAESALNRYVDQTSQFADGMKKVFPELDDVSLRSMVKNVEEMSLQSDHYRILTDPKLKEFWKNADEGVAQATAGHGGPSSTTRLTFAARDAIHGIVNPAALGYAANQLLYVAGDFTIGNMVRFAKKLRNAYTPTQALAERMKALNAITKKNESTMAKINETVSGLVSGVKTKPTSFGTNMPYAVYSRFDKTGTASKEVDEKYNRTVEFINSAIKNGPAHIEDLDKKMSVLSQVAPELSEQVKEGVLNKVASLTRSLPVQSPSSYGKAELTTLEKAHYVDCVEAALNPEKMLGLIQNGTITPAQMQYFITYNPLMYSKLVEGTRLKIATTGNVSTSSRIYSTLGIATSPSVSAPNLMKNAINPQPGITGNPINGMPSMPSATPKLRASGAEKSSYSDNIARKNTP